MNLLISDASSSGLKLSFSKSDLNASAPSVKKLEFMAPKKEHYLPGIFKKNNGTSLTRHESKSLASIRNIPNLQYDLKSIPAMAGLSTDFVHKVKKAQSIIGTFSRANSHSNTLIKFKSDKILITNKLAKIPTATINDQKQLSKFDVKICGDKANFDTSRYNLQMESNIVSAILLDDPNNNEEKPTNEMNMSKKILDGTTNSFFITKHGSSNDRIKSRITQKSPNENNNDHETPKSDSIYQLDTSPNKKINGADDYRKTWGSTDYYRITKTKSKLYNSKVKEDSMTNYSRESSLMGRSQNKDYLEQTQIIDKAGSASNSVHFDETSGGNCSDMKRSLPQLNLQQSEPGLFSTFSRADTPKAFAMNRQLSEKIIKRNHINEKIKRKLSQHKILNTINDSKEENFLSDKGINHYRINDNLTSTTEIGVPFNKWKEKSHTSIIKRNIKISNVKLPQYFYEESNNTAHQKLQQLKVKSMATTTKKIKNKKMNIPAGERSIFVIIGDFIEHGTQNLKIIKMNIPYFEYIDNEEDLAYDFQHFLDACQIKSLLNKNLHSLQLANGVYVQNLSQIPIECNILVAERASDTNFRTKFNNYHKIILTNIQWDLLIYVLNKQNNDKQIRYILFNPNIIDNILQNNKFPLDKIFNKRLITWDIIKLPTSNIGKLIRDKVKNHEELVEQTDDDSIKNTTTIIYENILNRPRMLDFELELLNIDNLKEDDRRDWINHMQYLLLNQYKQNNRQDQPQFYNQADKNNYIIQNIYNTGRNEVHIFHDIISAMPSLQNLNIPKLMNETGFKRKELYQHFSQYKALCELYGLNKKRCDMKLRPSAGFDKKILKGNLVQFMVSHDEITNRLVSSPMNIFGDQMMKWEDYLKLMANMNGKTINDQLHIFAKLIDSNGDGTLIWSEVKKLVSLSLDRFKSKDSDEVIDYLAEYFANFLFQSVNMPKDQEIPVSVLTKLILEGSEAAQMLLQMCGALGSSLDINNENISVNPIYEEKSVNKNTNHQFEYKEVMQKMANYKLSSHSQNL